MESEVADAGSRALVGTPSYMAPEQASGGGQIDARTDIYLFGLLLYEIYAGSAVGQDLQPGRIAELLQQHRDVIPETVAQVITRCLERAPSDSWSFRRRLLKIQFARSCPGL